MRVGVGLLFPQAAPDLTLSSNRALGVRQPHRLPRRLRFLLFHWVTLNVPVQSPVNTHLDCPPAFCFTEKCCGKYQHIWACQLLCLCSSLSVCPASITYLSIIYRLSSSTVIYLLFPLIYHPSITYYLSIHPSIICLLYHLSLSFIIYRLSTVY